MKQVRLITSHHPHHSLARSLSVLLSESLDHVYEFMTHYCVGFASDKLLIFGNLDLIVTKLCAQWGLTTPWCRRLSHSSVQDSCPYNCYCPPKYVQQFFSTSPISEYLRC